MIDKINTNQISDLMRDAVAKPANGSTGSNKVDTSLHVSYESPVANAAQELDNDAAVVDRARHLLLSGQLDTPENIRQAAENIIKYGI